jgi:hypothetical protein
MNVDFSMGAAMAKRLHQVHALPATLTLIAAVLLLHAAATRAEDPLRSGLQAGEQVTATFRPLNVTGPYAGEPHCLVCENGADPVAMIFARKLDQPLIHLLAKIDGATAQSGNQSMGSFVVFLSDEAELAERLAKLAEEKSLKEIVLSIDDPAGPDGFKVSPDAEVTVVLYREHEVKANHAFRAGELSEDSIEKILADLPRIVGDE